MDKHSFDAAVRGFAARRNRRSALAGLAAAAFGLGIARGARAQPGGELAACRNRCSRNADCNHGYRCGVASRRCFAIPDSRTRCDANLGCPNNWEVCGRTDRCVNQVPCVNCERNGDCDTGQQCKDGRCVVPECTSKSDCRRRQRCRRGRCVDRG